MKKIKDIFEVKYGHKSCESLTNLRKGKTAVITSGEYEHGVGGHFDIEVAHNHCISIARVGSVGVAFYQNNVTINSNCLVLSPKIQVEKNTMIWYAALITMQRTRWTYGRQVTPDRLKHIRLPAPPAWVNNISIPDYSHLKNAKSEEKVDLKDWKNFNIQELFNFEKGTGPSSEEAANSAGKTPYVNAQKHSNGILCYTEHAPTHKENCITWVAQGAGASGKAFAQNKAFCSTATVNVLVPKWTAKIEELIFVARVITEAEWKFSFGRAVNGNRKHIKISLPTKNGTPDWDGITKFIQSCKFSSTI